MAERKVLIKYYPPDFDPTKLIKNKRPLDKQDNVRMMIPMTVRCNTCGNYIYIGTKFNMRKETVMNESYLGIRIYRFYFKCTHCYTEITFKTDPKNHDYVLEFGATRNYEASRDNEKAEEVLRKLRENDEEGNAMKFLENRTNDNRRELDILDALDEIRHNSKKMLYATPEELIKLSVQSQIENEVYEELDEDESDRLEEFLASQRVRRIKDDDNDDDAETMSGISFFDDASSKKSAGLTEIEHQKPKRPAIKLRKIIKTEEVPVKVKDIPAAPQKANALSSLLGYLSNSESDEDEKDD